MSQLTDEDLWSILNQDGPVNPTAAVVSTLIQPADMDGVDTTALAHTATADESMASSDGDLDDDEYEDEDLFAQRTPKTFASSPLARLGLASVAGLVVVSVVGVMVGGFQGQVKEASEKSAKPSEIPTAAAPMVGQPPTNGELKAQMAFQSQQMQQDAAKNGVKPNQPPPPSIKPSPAPSPASTNTIVPPPPPAPEPIAAARLPPDPISMPLPSPSPMPVSPIPLANLSPIDPNKAWSDLAQSATYGSLPVMITPPAPPAPVPVAMPAPKLQTPQSDMGGLPSLSSYQLQSSNPSRKLRIGTQVKATLLNPIAWSGDGKDIAFSGNGAPTPKFIARLEQPLKDMDGNEVVPQGAEIVIAVRSLEPRSGMAELTALQMIIDNQEYAPPIGAITLRGAKGNPLIADKFQDKGKDIAAADRSMFFFGALSKVGELLNRTDSNVVITAGGSSSSSSSGKPNVLGGVLQGGFGALAQQQQQRNQQWLQEIIQRPDIRYIPAGKELSLYINQTVTL
jgi:Bacterial conjugation TrbI-like protein